MFSHTFILFILIAGIFLTGASMGQLLLRIRLEKLENVNLRLDEKRIRMLTRAIGSRTLVVEHRAGRFERKVRDEINDMISEIENS